VRGVKGTQSENEEEGDPLVPQMEHLLFHLLFLRTDEVVLDSVKEAAGVN